MSHPLPTAVLSVVTVAMLFLTGLALRSWRRSGNARLAFVAAAFGLFAFKSALTAYALFTGAVPHEALELLNSVFDLGIAALLIAPILLPPRRP